MLGCHLVFFELLISSFCMAALQAKQLVIYTTTCGQLVWRADFISFTTLDCDNFIHVLNSAQSVSNDNSGSVLHKVLKSLLDHGLTLTIKTAGSFVKNQN